MRNKKLDYPVLREKEIASEIAHRTGVPINTVIQIMYTYFDVIKECVSSSVGVKMGSLGVMGWRVKPPRYNKVFYNFATHQKDPPRDMPGYREPKFEVKVQWKKELKEVSKFWEKEDKEKEVGE